VENKYRKNGFFWQKTAIDSLTHFGRYGIIYYKHLYAIFAWGTVRHTVKTFMKLSMALCAVLTVAILFASGLAQGGGLVLTASAAEPTYDMSDEYKSGKFYKNFTSVKLTGDQRKDVIAIALSQLGYHEGDSEADFDGNSTDGVRDFVEYNVLAGKYDNGQGNGISYGYYWCASFVNWCMRQAGVSETASAGAEISCQRWIASCSSAGIYKSRGSYVPQSGDMVFFRDIGSAVSATHVGLVLYTEGGKVHTVEGNTSFTNDYSSDGEYVAIKSYDMDSDYIVGYAAPKYNAEKSYNRVDHSGGFKTTGQYIPHGRVEVYADQAMTQAIGEIDAFTLFDVIEVGGNTLNVNATVLGNSASGYISAGADVVQVTSLQKFYRIEYLDADGDAIFAPQLRLEDQKKKTYSNAPVRDDCGFVGWEYISGQQKIILAPGDELPAANEDISLVAVFDSNFYLVSFQNPDKTLISQSFGYYGTPIEVPLDLTVPEGYVFIGWDAEVSDIIMTNATYTAVFVTQAEYESMMSEGESRAESATAPAAAQTGCAATFTAIHGVLAAALIAAGVAFRKKK